MERDEELDAVARELREVPHIEKPDEKDPGRGGLCFLNHARVCGPDCVAYDSASVPHPADRCFIVGGLLEITALLREHRALQYTAAPTPPPSPFGAV